jgi:Fe-S-cluster containining protein
MTAGIPVDGGTGMSGGAAPAAVDAALQEVFSRIHARQTQATAAVVAAAGTTQELAEHAFAGAVGLAEAAIQAQPGRAHHACARGCNWCCHQLVRVSPVEAIAISGIIREHCPPPQLARVRAVLTDRATRIARLTDLVAYHAAGLRCGFLDSDGACSIHAWRPLVCRGHASMSRAACEEWYVDPLGAPPPPLDRATRLIALGVLHGMQDSLRAAGREAGTFYELHHAVLRALDTPDAAARWARGEALFAGCMTVVGRKID